MQNPAKISSFRVAYKNTPHVLNTEYLIVNNYSHFSSPTIQNKNHQNLQAIKQKKKKLYINRDPSVQYYKLCNKNSNAYANFNKQHIKSNSLDKNIKFSTLDKNIKFSTLEIKNKQILKHKTQSILHQFSKYQKLEQPIHSRKKYRFKILSGILKKYQQSDYYIQKSQSLDYHIMKIKKETLHDFNQTSIQYIRKLQKQAARAIKTAAMQCHTSQSKNRNQVRYQTRENKRIKINSPQFKLNPIKNQTCRPWSRQKNPQTWLYDDNNFLTILS